MSIFFLLEDDLKMDKRATHKQLEALATFVAEDQQLRRGKFGPTTRKVLEQKWKSISLKLYGMEGAIKTGTQWKKVCT